MISGTRSQQLFQCSLILKAYLVELVSKELNHFGGIALFFRDLAPGTLTKDELQEWTGHSH